MPGFTIHLAIGEQYIKKHKEEIKNKKEFIKGIIAPDLNEKMTDIEKNKSKSHYGKWEEYSATTNIEQFLKDKNVNVNEDYWKGYFLHLLTDYYFYNIDFLKESKEIRISSRYFWKTKAEAGTVPDVPPACRKSGQAWKIRKRRRSCPWGPPAPGRGRCCSGWRPRR